MKKLRLDSLRVDSFATTGRVAHLHGTVAGREQSRSMSMCPESWNGTCYITCATCVPCAVPDTEGC
ncbi:MAG TPA: hypothetical protein VF705_10675 [Longimicrobium sp.]